MNTDDCHTQPEGRPYMVLGMSIATASDACSPMTKTTAKIERSYPYVVAFIAAVACWRIAPVPPKSTVQLLAAVINVASIAVAFLATAQAIVLSADEIRVIRHLKQMGGY